MPYEDRFIILFPLYLLYVKEVSFKPYHADYRKTNA